MKGIVWTLAELALLSGAVALAWYVTWACGLIGGL